jgi:hypothetical protein
MKKVAYKTATTKRATLAVRKVGGGRSVRRTPKLAVAGAAKAATLRYDAEDIEEANRIGAAVCRQHAS